jgi:hypothetical protein
VSSNSASDIRAFTQSGFQAYSTDHSLKDALKQVTKLKGVGPATASLVLSAYDPASAIFFSDEVFRWLCWNEPMKGNRGWDRKIGYTVKEYILLAEKAAELIKRLKVTALEMEMVAYVLGKEHVDVDKAVNDSKPEAENNVEKHDTKTAGSEKEEATPSNLQSGTKRSRKAAKIDEPVTSRSKRKKA